MVMAVADRDTGAVSSGAGGCVGTLRDGAGPDRVTEVAVTQALVVVVGRDHLGTAEERGGARSCAACPRRSR